MSEARDTARMYDAAAANGCIVVTPEPNEVFVDIDDARSFDVFNRHIEILKELGIVASFKVGDSPSGKPERKHITVTLTEPVSGDEQRVLFQALLGSDLLREILNWKRIRLGITPVSVFFEKESVAQAMQELAP